MVNTKMICMLVALGSIVTPLLFAVDFEHMNLQQEIDVQALDVVTESMVLTNDTVVVMQGGKSLETMPDERLDFQGLKFEVNDEGCIEFNIQEEAMGISLGKALDRILVNGKPLSMCIDELVQRYSQGVNMSTVSNLFSDMVYNPLWGKKLAVIGDSLISSPTLETSYPYYIAQRNNMRLVHKGRSGERLCEDRSSTNLSTLKSYTNDIPSDADYILCQIGANDTARWSVEEANEPSDEDMTTNNFKGCWNNLLFGLKKNYPNAKIGMILANNWTENLGYKTEDVLDTDARRRMTQWQKIQCQKLNIPVFDPVEDTRQFTWHYVTYPTNGTTITVAQIDASELSWYDRMKREMGTDNSRYREKSGEWVFQTQYMNDSEHTSTKGNQVLSFFYERWMKTVLAND